MISDAPSLRPLVSAAGRDADTAIDTLAGMYAGKRWQSGPIDDDYWFRYVAVGDEHVSIRRSQLHGTLRGDIAVEDEVVVQWLEHGAARLDVGGDEIRMQPGIPTMFPMGRRFEVVCADWDQRLVHLSADLVRDVAAERHLLSGPLTLTHPSPANPDVIEQWRAVVGGALHTLRRDGQDSLAWYEARRDVARSVLRLFPLQAEHLSTDGGRRSDRQVRLAVEFMHAHAAERLSIAAIAAAVGMSVRGLQVAFQRNFGTTPMTYVHDVRLSRAHDELQTADPSTASVAGVARRWGFRHMGRFSSAYASRFGEYPRRTLRH